MGGRVRKGKGNLARKSLKARWKLKRNKRKRERSREGRVGLVEERENEEEGQWIDTRPRKMVKESKGLMSKAKKRRVKKKKDKNY